MNPYFFVLLLVFMVVVMPIFLGLHYTTKAKASKSLTNEDERLLQDLWQLSQKLNNRIDAIETILDKDHENWTAGAPNNSGPQDTERS